MNYEEARVYLDNVAKYGSVLGLDAMRELLRRLGIRKRDGRSSTLRGLTEKALSWLSFPLC